LGGKASSSVPPVSSRSPLSPLRTTPISNATWSLERAISAAGLRRQSRLDRLTAGSRAATLRRRATHSTCHTRPRPSTAVSGSDAAASSERPRGRAHRAAARARFDRRVAAARCVRRNHDARTVKHERPAEAVDPARKVRVPEAVTEAETAVAKPVAARAQAPEGVVAERIIERVVGVAQAKAEARIAIAISIAISIAVAVTRRDDSTHDIGRRIVLEAIVAAHATHDVEQSGERVVFDRSLAERAIVPVTVEDEAVEAEGIG